MNRLTKHVVIGLVLVSLVLGIMGSVGVANAATQLKLTVAMEAMFAPMEYLDKSGKIIGFDYDMMLAMKKARNWDLTIKNVSWNSIFAGLTTKRYDMVCSSVSITEERKATMEFSKPYLNSGLIIVVRKDDNSIKSLADLKGKVVAVQTSTTGDYAVSDSKTGATKYGIAEVKRYDSIALAHIAIKANKKIVAVINDRPVEMFFMRNNPGFKVAGAPLNSEDYGIAIRKGNTALVTEINAALNAIKANGEFARIHKKWFGTAE